MSWISFNTGITGSPTWYSVASNSSGDFIAVAYYGEIYKLVNGTSSWSLFNTGIISGSLLSAITSNPSGDFIAVGATGEIYKLVNGGSSWSLFNTGISGSLNWVSVASNLSGDFIAVAYTGEIYKLVNGTSSWSSFNTGISGSPNWNSIASNPSGDFIAVADTGEIYKLVNGTSSWSSFNTGISGSPNWISIASNPSGDFIAVAASGEIYKLVDGSSSWSLFNTGISGSPNWFSIASNPSGDLIALTFYGEIYKYSIIANICFPKGTPILTDQGVIAIDKIDIEVNTINQKKIIDITKTVSKETFLVCFEKNALGLDMPNQETIISPGHTLLYEGEMHQAKWFLEKFSKVKSIPYTGETLYNVLLKNHDTMNVNNLICETLLPENPIAKFYTKQCKLSPQDRDIMVNILKGCLDRNDIATYHTILKCC
jgi:photosystem II stability/assembly factor-like uncharacterized protein